jgi:hypothetical protein
MYSPYFHYKKDCTFISTQNAKESIKKTLGAIDPHYESLLVKQIQDFNKNFKGKPKDNSPPNRTTSTSSGSYAAAYTPYQGEFLQPHHSQFINSQPFKVVEGVEEDLFLNNTQISTLSNRWMRITHINKAFWKELG